MKLITPTTIGDAQFVSSTVPETDHAEWSAATVYAIGDRVIVAATHKVYEALTAHTNKPPADNLADWLDLGSTNRWKMFDQKVGTATSATESFTVTLAPGLINAVALLNVTGSAVRLVMTDPSEGVVYDRTFDLYDPLGITDWCAYFFDDIRTKSTLVAADLPSYSGATLAITVSGGAGATVSIGAGVVGRLRQYAPSVGAGASVGIQDYSRKERDAWGNSYVVERAFSKRARWSFVFGNHDIDTLQAQLAALRAVPAVYIGSDRYASTVIYGFFRDFDVVIAYPMHSECSIEIEGLV